MTFIDLIIYKNRFQQNLATILRSKFLIKKVLKAYFQRVFLRKNIIRLVEIAVCYECNAKCDQCSCALSFDKKKKRLSLEEFKKLIDDSINLGAFQFNLTGGEPLLFWKETIELINYIRTNNCYAHLCTNGFLLNEKKVKQLKEAGLSSIEFGLDSAESKIHDKNRGLKGAFKKVMEMTKIAKELGIPVIWDTIITHEKIKNGDVLKIIQLAEKKEAFVQITPPCVMGRWMRRKEIVLEKEEKNYFKKLLTQPWARTDTYSGFLKIGCSAAREKFAVNPYGDVLPCSLIQISYGNIRQQSLSQIQKKMIKNHFYHHQSGILSCLPSFNHRFIKKYLQ